MTNTVVRFGPTAIMALKRKHQLLSQMTCLAIHSR
jgi:hypothetical protein